MLNVCVCVGWIYRDTDTDTHSLVLFEGKKRDKNCGKQFPSHNDTEHKPMCSLLRQLCLHHPWGQVRSLCCACVLAVGVSKNQSQYFKMIGQA